MSDDGSHKRGRPASLKGAQCPACKVHASQKLWLWHEKGQLWECTDKDCGEVWVTSTTA